MVFYFTILLFLFSYLNKYLFMFFHELFDLFNIFNIQSIYLFAYPLEYFFSVFVVLFDSFITLCLYFIVQLLTDSFAKLSYQIVYLDLGAKDISEIRVEHKRSNNLSLKLNISIKLSPNHFHDVRWGWIGLKFFQDLFFLFFLINLGFA